MLPLEIICANDQMNTILSGRKRSWLWAAVAFAGICTAVALYLRPPTLEQVARRGLKAIETRDAKLLIRNMTREEVRALKLDDRNLRRFLDSFVGRRLSGFVRTGGPKITPLSESKQLIAVQEYTHPDGRRVRVGITTAMTQDGPRITSAIASLTIDMLMADLPAGAGLPGGRARLAFFGLALQRALPELASAGIPGLLRQGTVSGRDEFFTFEEFAKRSQRLGAGESVSSATGD